MKPKLVSLPDGTTATMAELMERTRLSYSCIKARLRTGKPLTDPGQEVSKERAYSYGGDWYTVTTFAKRHGVSPYQASQILRGHEVKQDLLELRAAVSTEQVMEKANISRQAARARLKRTCDKKKLLAPRFLHQESV